MAKVLILTGDAAESLEVMYPYQRGPSPLDAGVHRHLALEVARVAETSRQCEGLL
jgi:hypothetical protein